MNIFLILNMIGNAALLVLGALFLRRLRRIDKSRKEEKEKEERRREEEEREKKNVWQKNGNKEAVFFNWLIEEKGIQDPYVQLYAYLHDGDVDKIQRFIENTPDLDMLVTEVNVIAKYFGEYQEFMLAPDN